MAGAVTLGAVYTLDLTKAIDARRHWSCYSTVLFLVDRSLKPRKKQHSIAMMT